MAVQFPAPPTYAEVVLVDPRNQRPPRFNPIWLRWFLDLAQVLTASGGGGGVIEHNATSGIQGGGALERYHITQASAAWVESPGDVYTPTLTNVTNLAASTAFQSQWMRSGNFVLVSGKVSVDPTAAGVCKLGISLPLASNIGANQDCCGVAFASGIAGQGAAILGDATNDRAQMEWIAVDVTNQPMYYIFQYRII